MGISADGHSRKGGPTHNGVVLHFRKTDADNSFFLLGDAFWGTSAFALIVIYFFHSIADQREQLPFHVRESKGFRITKT
ncbi:hypothetical protein FACS189411_09670 [Bacteroidia bacterium]|nr:hypothetical protein FACS189411_09670 [Bacteroidia bacterium]